MGIRMCHVQNKNITKEQKFPGIMVRAQENGWMDSEFILDFIQCVWEHCPSALLKFCGTVDPFLKFSKGPRTMHFLRRKMS
jgi:hypothetical protein